MKRILTGLAAVMAASILAAAGNAAPLISEFQPNPSGADPAMMDFELSGDPNAAFSGVVISVESDPGSSTGRVDRISPVSGTFDANGILNLSIADLENPSFTVVLLDSFSGDTNTDIDTDDDGVADDLSTFGAVYDALGVPDTNGEPLYGAQLGGVDLSYIGTEPPLVFRSGSTGDWYATDFSVAYDAAGTAYPAAPFTADPLATTFGAVNPEFIPEPASVALALMAGVGMLAVRRRK